MARAIPSRTPNNTPTSTSTSTPRKATIHRERPLIPWRKDRPRGAGGRGGVLHEGLYPARQGGADLDGHGSLPLRDGHGLVLRWGGQRHEPSTLIPPTHAHSRGDFVSVHFFILFIAFTTGLFYIGWREAHSQFISLR
jgi:hypothetical protein